MTPFNVVEIVALVYLGHLLQTYAQTAGSQEANIPCYWAANKTLDPAFVPCGDPNTGVKWCCEVGSNCLANNSCYMSLYGVTYLAGCTDPSYTASECPDKVGYEDHYWSGLVLCPNSTSRTWLTCSDDGPTLGLPARCTCPDNTADGDIAFTAAANPIPNIMALYGNGVSSCFPGHETACSTATTTVAHSPTMTTAINGIVSTSVVTASAAGGVQDSNGASPRLTVPSQTAVIGISIGSAAGGLILAALVWLLFAFLRRRRREAPPPPPIEDQIRQRSPDGSATGLSEKLDPEDPRSPTWSGNKSELPAEEPGVISPATGNSSVPEKYGLKSPSISSPGTATYESCRVPYRTSKASEMEGSLGQIGGSGTGSRRTGGGAGEMVYEMPA